MYYIESVVFVNFTPKAHNTNERDVRSGQRARRERQLAAAGRSWPLLAAAGRGRA